jgi:YVTN family beta-propeller protein
MAVNQDGSKVFVVATNNRSAIIRFPTNDYVAFTETLGPRWIGVSADHTYAISGHGVFSVVSLVTESIVGQWIGDSQWFGAVSPAGYRAVSCDPHNSDGAGFYDFTAPGAPVCRGSTPCGQVPEGDAPRRVKITPDGRRAVVLNDLSANATILDLEAPSVAAIVPIGNRPQEVAITSDSRWAVITAILPGAISILDLATNQVVACLPCGTFPSVIAISPDNQTAYVGDTALDVVWVVRLAGANSQVLTQIPVGRIGSLLLAGGIHSDVAVSPDGNEVLVAVSFENKVQVIDTHTNTVVAEVWVNGDFPLQLAFEETGDYAMVTNWTSDNVTNMRIDGANSVRIDNRGWGDGPLRLASNPVHDQIGVGILYDRKVVHLDPATGALIRSDDYSSWGSVLQVLFDETGEPIVLAIPSDGPGTLVRNGEGVTMPAPACVFDYCPATRAAVVVCPGPDYAVVVVWNTTSAPQVVTIPLSGKPVLETPRPVPAAGSITLAFALPRGGPVALDLFDPAGRLVANLAHGDYGSGRHEVRWPGDGVAAGTYLAVLTVNGARADARKVTLLGR